jgi:hypothetical protein
MNRQFFVAGEKQEVSKGKESTGKKKSGYL